MEPTRKTLPLKQIRFNQEFLIDGELYHLKQYADRRLREGQYEVCVVNRHGRESWMDWNQEAVVLTE